MSVQPREFEFPCYVLRRDTQNQWRWVYFARNGEPIAVSSESYKRVEDCRHGIEIMTALRRLSSLCGASSHANCVTRLACSTTHSAPSGSVARFAKLRVGSKV